MIRKRTTVELALITLPSQGIRNTRNPRQVEIELKGRIEGERERRVTQYKFWRFTVYGV
jgi:hypothetical protein